MGDPGGEPAAHALLVEGIEGSIEDQEMIAQLAKEPDLGGREPERLRRGPPARRTKGTGFERL
jgi:hypothetical protein